jgi:hemolysin activation/secretion protein
MFESYRDRREAGQYLGRELQRTLPALLQQHQQRLQEHQQQQQEQQQQDQQQQDQHIPDPVHHDSTSTAAATGSPQLDVKDIVVLGLVRGGMPVADAVARALHCPCDAFVVRKIGAPRQPE